MLDNPAEAPTAPNIIARLLFWDISPLLDHYLLHPAVIRPLVVVEERGLPIEPAVDHPPARLPEQALGAGEGDEEALRFSHLIGGLVVKPELVDQRGPRRDPDPQALLHQRRLPPVRLTAL